MLQDADFLAEHQNLEANLSFFFFRSRAIPPNVALADPDFCPLHAFPSRPLLSATTTDVTFILQIFPRRFLFLRLGAGAPHPNACPAGTE